MANRFRMGDREVDLGAGKVHTADGEVPLTRNEVGLLEVLFRHAGTPVPRDVLLREGLGYRADIASRAVDQTVWRLRRKLEPDPRAPRYLRAEANEGYGLFVPPPAPISAPGTPFFGRSAERALLVDALQRSRVAVVSGPPGVGKSRLVTESLPEAVVVPLGAARDDQDVEAAVQAALRSAPGARVVVFDGADAVPGAVARLAASVVAQGDRSVVVTCRRPLDLHGARVVRVGPLSNADAAALFVDRSTRADAGSAFSPEVVEALVGALDGLPLGIEHAARRAPSMLPRTLRDPVAALREALPHGLVDLYTALPAAQRERLEAWAVFEGPFGLEDLVAIDGRAPHVLLDLLQELIEDGLARSMTEPDGVRYALLGVFRELARRSGMAAGAVARHAAHFARLGDPAWLDATQGDREARRTLRAASADLAAVVAGAAPADLRAACALALVWRLSREGAAAEGLATAHAARDLPCALRVRAGLAIAEARLCAQINAAARGLTVVDAVLCGPQAGALAPDDEGELRCVKAMLLRLSGATERVHPELDRAGALPLGDRARARWLQTTAMYAESLAHAEPKVIEAARLLAGLGDRVAEGTAWTLLAHIAEVQGAPSKSARYFRRGLAVLSDDDLAGRARALALLNLVRLERARGALDEVRAALDEAEPLLERWGTPDARACARIERTWLLGDDDAVAALEREIAHLTGGDRTLGDALVALAERQMRRGDRRSAQEAVEEGLSSACSGRSGAQEAVMCSLLAAILGEDGRLPEADALLARAAATAPQGTVLLHVLLVRAWIGAARGDPALAQEELDRAEAVAQSVGIQREAALEWWRRRARLAVGRETGRVLAVPRTTSG